MLFNTFEYFIFLALVLQCYYVLNRPSQNLLLLGASFFFCGYWDYRFLAIILFTILVQFYTAQAIHRSLDPGRRKLFLGLSIAASLTILGYFKHFNFFLQNAGRLTRLLGLNVDVPVLHIILPIGISFLTFQTLSYTLDIYSKRIAPINSLVDYSLFVSYFPKLIAGPIERAGEFFPQIQTKRIVTTEMFVGGCYLILIGLFRKVVIADGLAAQIDPYFDSSASYSTPYLIKALYLYALQIYCDFAGYSDIARGTSRLLGIELTVNFNHPYFAPTISDFWRRWNISLSTWLRDYLFFPLLGNRTDGVAVYRSLLITMLLAGLWHGAAWCFVIWGGLHGLYLIVNWVLLNRIKQIRLVESLPLWSGKRLLGMFLTFHLVLLSLVFFRSPGLKAALSFLGRLCSFEEISNFPNVLPLILIPWILTLSIDVPQYLGGRHTMALSWPRWVQAASIATMLLMVIISFGIHAPFIYSKF